MAAVAEAGSLALLLQHVALVTRLSARETEACSAHGIAALNTHKQAKRRSEHQNVTIERSILEERAAV